MHRRLLTALAAAAALATVAAGCGGSGHSGGTTAGVSGARASNGTLTIMGFGTNGDDVAMSRFRIAQKAVAPTKVSAPNGGFNEQQFLAAVASGSPPDLIYADRYEIGTLAAKGALQPLSSCIESQRIDMSQFRKPAVQEVTYKGQIYGIPEFYDNRTIIVNDAAVEKAGLAPRDISTTNWTRLAATAKKLTTRSGGKLTTIGFDPKLPEFFPLWAKANGAGLISADGLHAQLDSAKAVQALTYAVSLIKAEGGWNQFSSFRNTWD